MFSGKSRELIRLMHIAEIAGQTTVLFKPRIDTRYSHSDISSHDGIRADAHSVDGSREILAVLDQRDSRPQVVGVDEGQFFDAGLVAVCLWLRDRGPRVVVAGLDRNFRGEPFGGMPDLLACADEVIKLRAVCARCKDPRVTATLPQRLIDGMPAPYDSPEVLVGGADRYEARCLDCHEVPGRPDFSQLVQAALPSTASPITRSTQAPLMTEPAVGDGT